MLSMKTLRVAIATMGSALLLGAGLAVAQTSATTIDLDEPLTPDRTIVYVAETLGTGDSAITSGAARGYSLLNNANALAIRVTSRSSTGGKQILCSLGSRQRDGVWRTAY